jgi:hypothetical protein
MSLRDAAASRPGRRAVLVAAAGLVCASVSVAEAAANVKHVSANRVLTVYSVASGLQYINTADDRARGHVNNPLDSTTNKLAPRSSGRGDGSYAGDIAVYSVNLKRPVVGATRGLGRVHVLLQL